MFWILILGLEFVFWITALGFVLSRYWWQRPGLARILLIAAIVFSVAQVPVAVWDWKHHDRLTILHIGVLWNVVEAGAILVGILLFGTRRLRRIEERFALRMALIRDRRRAGQGWFEAIEKGWGVDDGPRETPESPEHQARRERKEWAFHAAAFAIVAGGLLLAERTGLGNSVPALKTIGVPWSAHTLMRVWTTVFVIDTIWSWSYTFWPEEPAKPRPEDEGKGNTNR